MGKFIDLKGKTFTYLKVLYRSPNRKTHTMWMCECICGKQKAISGCDLRNRRVKGCGSFCSYEPRKRIEGKKFGKLTVIKLIHGERSSGKDSRPLWEVQCECNFLFKTTLHALNPGKGRIGLRQCSNCSKNETQTRLVSKVFYYLKVVSFSHEDQWGGYIWKCICRCGNIVFASTSSLKRSSTKSCGCYSKALLKKHGKSKTSLYRIWHHARRRCNLPSEKSYPRYGGRGISMCQEWLEDFERFESWAQQNGYALNLQLDRINVDKGYYPDNCQFISKNCNSAFAWVDKMNHKELKITEDRIARRRITLLT